MMRRVVSVFFFFEDADFENCNFFSARAKCNAAVCHVVVRHAKRANSLSDKECIYFVLDVCTSLAHLSLATLHAAVQEMDSGRR